MKAFIVAIYLVSLIGCNKLVPVLNPVIGTAIQAGLVALSYELAQHGASTIEIDAIAAAEAAIAADTTGATWGSIVRTLLTTLYSDLPLSTQNAVWAYFQALETDLGALTPPA
jgi:hypothetical protein